MRIQECKINSSERWWKKSIASRYYLFIAIWFSLKPMKSNRSKKVVWNIHSFRNELQFSDLYPMYERKIGILPDRIIIIHRRSEIATTIRCHLTRFSFLFCFHVAKFLKTLCRTDTCYVLEKYIYIFIYMRVRFTVYAGIRLAPQFLI